MTRRRRLLLILLLVPLAVYALIVAGLWVFQERILFPAYIVPAAGALPPGVTTLSLDTGDGESLAGVHVPAASPRPGASLILAFAGNASNAQGFAALLHDLYPEHDIVAFFYRGYAPSTGVAAARALAEDAPLIHDFVLRRFRPARVVVIGMSIGSGIAASLVARRPVAGAILITPFDSLSATASQHYPWLPVSWLLRHDIRQAELLASAQVPVAIVAAGRDEVVMPARTEALRHIVPRLVFDATLEEARHNDIVAHTGFSRSMREAMVRVEAAQ